MVKTNLPVILLRGAVLLPYCEFRLELNNDIDKYILKLSEDFHDKHILIVSPSNPLEEVIDIDSLPKIGTVAKINMKMELGNITRIMLEGVNRVKVEEYVNYGENDSVLNAVITSTTQFAMSPLDETALIRKLNSVIEHIFNIFEYPVEIRKIIYTTNPIESLNSSLRKVIRGKGSFISKEALLKVLYLRIKDLEKSWSKGTRNWENVKHQLIELYGERVLKYYFNT